MAYLIGIDVGTSGTKALLVRSSGKVVAEANVEYGMETPEPGWAEQRPESWWEASVSAIQWLLKEGKIEGEQVRGIGLSGQMHSSVFLDDKFEVIRPALLWCDQRTAAECDEITEKIGFDKLIELTANRALTGFTAPKILWLKNHEPENYKRFKHLLLSKDYIRYKLTGELVTDVSDASGMLLFDVVGRRWSDELLSKLDIDPSVLPGCIESTEISGQISPKAAELTGLKAGTPVVGGGGDQAAGAVGNGIVREGPILITIGTSGVVFSSSDRPLVDPQARLHSFCHASPGLWHTMGVMLSAGGSMRWLRDRFTALQQGQPYELLTKRAAAVAPGSEGLIFLPYLTGERTPHYDPHARGVFFGIGLGHGQRHLTRALMEGVTYGLKDSVEIMKEVGTRISEVYLSGGGAKSDLWTQIVADVLDLPIRRLAVDEGPSYGAALLAGVGTGVFKDTKEAAAKTLSLKDEMEPIPENAERYREIYPHFKSVYKCLKPEFEALADLQRKITACGR